MNYCDDLITGCDDIAELKYLRDAVVDKLNEACFPLRKFRTNVPCIFANDPISTTCSEKYLSKLKDQYSNLQNQSSFLGLKWCLSRDSFHFLVDFQIDPVITKRNILATTSKIFDRKCYYRSYGCLNSTGTCRCMQGVEAVLE